MTQVNGERTFMAVNSERPRPVRTGDFWDRLDASDRRNGSTSSGGVFSMPRNPGGRKRSMVTETKWRAISAIVSAGLLVGSVVAYWGLIHR
jgi:hypothetical protein